MDAIKLARLIELGVRGTAEQLALNPEYVALKAEIDAEEEERRKRDPKVITQEISDALELALRPTMAAVPEGYLRFGSRERDLFRGRTSWVVAIDRFQVPVWGDLSALNELDPLTPATVATKWVEPMTRAFDVADLQDWRTEWGERGIRSIIADVASQVASHVQGAK